MGTRIYKRYLVIGLTLIIFFTLLYQFYTPSCSIRKNEWIGPEVTYYIITFIEKYFIDLVF